MNINILNKTIQGIAEQLPLVSSFYTLSPYESWNTKEVSYGSVSFVVTNVNTRESTTTYDAVLYYADRLLEDRSNRDSVHSDAATVIQIIVGALNTADDLFQIEYPVSITLFEQDFSDVLAGGYAKLSIATEGMGECFEDDWSVPEIIATSAYYTKDEITELFPLRTDLSLVAFSGRFEDLSSKPDVVTQSQFDALYKGVLDSTGALASEMNNKLDTVYFGEFKKKLEAQLKDKVSQAQYNDLYNGVLETTSQLAAQLKDKLDATAFAAFKNATESALLETVKSSTFNTFVEGQNTINSNTAEQLASKVSQAIFNSEIESLKTAVGNMTDISQYEDLYRGVLETTSQLAEQLKEKLNGSTFSLYQDEVNNKLSVKLDTSVFNAFKETVEKQLKDKATKQQFDDLYNVVLNATETLAAEIDTKLDAAYFSEYRTGLESTISSLVTRQSFDNFAENVYTKKELDEVLSTYEENVNQYLQSEEFGDFVDGLVSNAVIEFTEEYLESALDYYTTDEIDDMLSNLSLDNYYNKEEIDNMIGNINTILNNILYEL